MNSFISNRIIHHHNYQFIRIIIGCIGILTIISHIISAFLWISYIIGWRINRKLKYIQQKQEINHHISIISNRNNINLRQKQQEQQAQQQEQEGQQQEQQEQGQQPPLSQQQRRSLKLYKHNLTWPICTLRISTQIIIFSMVIINIIGFIDLIRLIYLSITGNDLRLLTNDWLCRIQIFISFISCDISEWHFVILCIERCYIILYPRKYYSINNTLIKPALIMIIIIYIISILANIFLFISNESICFIKFPKNNNNWNDNLFNLISILYWLIQSITSYILMLGAISIRNDIQIIIWYIWYNILKRNK
uniref:G_PROTEIN_RECEP_F1_2 domain-containing protein n=1 Tax=Schistosoma mansoni TaxID=6183 RepID=A0A5K4F5Q8_SCHMA